MTDKKNLSRQGFGGVRYLLENDTRLVTYRAGATTNIALKLYTDSTGTTNGSGSVTWDLPIGYFTAVYAVNVQVVRNTADPSQATFAVVRTWGVSQVVAQCFESKNTGVLLGGVIEGLEASGAGVIVQLVVYGS